MRATPIVVLPPVLGENLRLHQARELLHVEQLIPKTAVERLGVSVLPERTEIWLEVVYGCVERGGVSLVG
jgi:hypothetical protein